ncbi:MAG TPA: tripartite tricarboxylate transporter TctB family protein [Woeseiaceae bacterium]|nr:tripartite tricarboxylate transporter TctB family protein [Woeseiaceae bacterium]
MAVKALLNGRVGTALMMALIFLAMTLFAIGLPEKARLMPLMVGIPGSLLGIVQLVVEIRGTIRNGPPEVTAERRKAELGMYLWVLLFFLGILGFGFIYGATALVFAFMVFGTRERLLTAVISAIATWAVLYGVFEEGLQIVLFKGLVLGHLMG